MLLLEIFGPKVPNSWKYFSSLYIIETATVQAKSALDLVTISYQLLWYFSKGRDSPFVRIVSSSCFPDSSVGKEFACSVGDLGLISGLGRSPGEGKHYPLQYSGLENSMDCVVLEVEGVRLDWAALIFTFSFVIAFLPKSKCPLIRGCRHCPHWFWSPRK